MDKELFDLWRAWRTTPRPLDNFRAGSRNAPSYDLECDLDHTIGWIAALGEELIERRVRGDAWLRIADEQIGLQNHLMVLDSIAVTDEQKQRLRSYISQTQTLLEKLANVFNEEKLT